jgi:hypothetical protein
LVIEKVVQLLSLKKLSSNLEFDRFKNYIYLFEIWEHFFSSEITELIKYNIPSDCTFKDRIYVLKSKMNGHLIATNKTEVVLNFVNALHKNIMTAELKKAMDDDTWQAVDIPTNFYEPIGYLISGDIWTSILSLYADRRNVQTTVLENSIFYDRSLNKRDRLGSDQSTNARPDDTVDY